MYEHLSNNNFLTFFMCKTHQLAVEAVLSCGDILYTETSKEVLLFLFSISKATNIPWGLN